MNIGKVVGNIASETKKAYVKNGSKFATSIEKIADSKIEQGTSALELWQKARASSIRWQTKNTPNAIFGDHKKLLSAIESSIKQLGLEAERPCFTGFDKYDDFIRIGENWYDTYSFIGASKKLGDNMPDFASDIKKLYDEHNNVRIYGPTVKFLEENPLCDTLNHILESQKLKRGY